MRFAENNKLEIPLEASTTYLRWVKLLRTYNGNLCGGGMMCIIRKSIDLKNYFNLFLQDCNYHLQLSLKVLQLSSRFVFFEG